MMRRLALPLCLLALLVISLPGYAVDERATGKRSLPGEWPQWRGPSRDGISTETGLLKKWSNGQPKLAWKAGGLGVGYASIAIADGKILSMGNRDNAESIIALDLNKGTELWTARVGEEFHNGNAEGPRCTPTVSGGLVYVVGGHGDLVCVRAADGQEVWRKSLPNDFGGKMHSGWGFSESPLVDGDRVICTPGGEDAGLVALNKDTGEEIWRCAIPELGDKGGDGAAYSSVVVSNGAGVRQYVQLLGRGVVGVRAKDGKFLWGYNPVANNVANIPTPLVRDDYVFCSTGYGTGAALLKLIPSGDGVRAEEVYFLEAKDFQNHHGGMIMVGDYVYCGHGHNQGFPLCLEWKTGKIAWSQGRGPGSGSAAVAYADGNLYFRYQDGTVALISATPKEYKLNGTFQIPNVQDPSWPHPVVAGGKLYLREQDTLYCYNLKR